MKRYVIEDKEKCEFSVHRSVFTDQEILEKNEMKIFSKSWLYIGHETELPNKGDFKRRKVGGNKIYAWQ